METEWITQSEYARKHGLSRAGVYYAVREGRLESNGKRGRACRVRGSLAPSLRGIPNRRGGAQAEPEGEETRQAREELQAARLEKLRLQIALQQARNPENQARERRAILTALLESYRAAYAGVRERFAELELPPPELENLQKEWDSSAARFEAALTAKIDECSGDRFTA